jgi:hypothetical protein
MLRLVNAHLDNDHVGSLIWLILGGWVIVDVLGMYMVQWCVY